MTRAPSVSPLLVKEFQALLPLWAGTLAALVAATAGIRRWPSDLAVIGYIGGVFALSAHAIGHEYGHRTLPMLLAQPVSRWRLFGAKLLILGAMLATLAGAAFFAFTWDGLRVDDAMRMVILPILGGLFTAPLFTMLCRSTLAGAVLGPSVPMTLWVVTLIVAWWGFGIDVNTMSAWVLDRWLMVAVIACPILAVLTWHTCSRVEAVEGMPITLTLPRWMSARAGSRRLTPWRALAAKELHLQQMTIAITLLYGVIWSIAVAVRQSAPTLVELPVEAVLLLYCMGLTIVIGALASAEERQQGTLEVQLLQPISAFAQWAVKCAVALGLAIVLGLVLPAALLAIFADQIGSSQIEISLAMVFLVMVLTSSSLYISSLTSSGVKAMTWSVPAGIGAAIFIQTTRSAIASASTRLGNPVPADTTEALLVASQVLTLLLVPALLWFGFVNHTAVEHPWRRTLAQIGTLAVLVATAVFAGALIP
jgi:ABC-type transport system involved in multi-copper enzyme maturation permease subunit